MTYSNQITRWTKESTFQNFNDFTETHSINFVGFCRRLDYGILSAILTADSLETVLKKLMPVTHAAISYIRSKIQ